MTKVLLLPVAALSTTIAGLGPAVYAIAAVAIVVVLCLLLALIRRDVVLRVESGGGVRRVSFERLPREPPPAIDARPASSNGLDRVGDAPSRTQ